MSGVVFTPMSPIAAGMEAALDHHDMAVVAFCAAWCNTCGEFNESFVGLAQERPEATFLWIDIEDDASVVGEIDIENFPTLAVFVRGRLVHFGVSLPQIGVVSRLLSSLDDRSPAITGQDAARGFLDRLIVQRRAAAGSA